LCEAQDHKGIEQNPATCGGEAELNFFADLSENIRKRIIEYVQLKCKKQRQLCLDNVEYGRRGFDEDMYSVRDESILNAPMPDLF
jgi:hypothetical protein